MNVPASSQPALSPVPDPRTLAPDICGIVKMPKPLAEGEVS